MSIRNRAKTVRTLAASYARFTSFHDAALVPWDEQLELQNEVITYVMQHYTPLYQGRALYEMLHLMRGLKSSGIDEKRLNMIYALLALRHLTDDERAELHMQAAQLCRPTGPHEALGDHRGHLRTAQRLAGDGFAEMEHRYGFQGEHYVGSF